MGTYPMKHRTIQPVEPQRTDSAGGAEEMRIDMELNHSARQLEGLDVAGKPSSSIPFGFCAHESYFS
jgi:hypothetical protein